MVLAETLSNVHSFIIIATNHCGDDLYRFDSPCKVQRACVQLDYKIIVQLYEYWYSRVLNDSYRYQARLLLPLLLVIVSCASYESWLSK